MKSKLIYLFTLFVALFAGYMLAVVNAPANAASADAVVPAEARQDESTLEIDERVIVALEAIAENTKSLEEIVSRLEGIEQELAWKRMDEQGGQ